VPFKSFLVLSLANFVHIMLLGDWIHGCNF
jgi:hypothetical protein